MRSLKQLFEYLNDVNFLYVVLRNWDNLPYSAELGEHSDLDLLVYDLKHFLEIIPEAVPEFPEPRVRYRLPIGDSCIYMDLRHVGDGYYPEDLEWSILKNREYHPSGFFTPDSKHFLISLAYHVVHHKGKNTYCNKLGNVTEDELFQALKKSGVGWCEPKDPTVGRFNPYWSGATSNIEKKDGVILKKQYSYAGYDLIKNEYQILSGLDSRHFPKVFNLTDGCLEIEDCGSPLTIDNLPSDWEIQLREILEDLWRHRVSHRDIRPDNLLVKDGVIKLIDFGWATSQGQAETKEPPSCLGLPYRPSWGFDDSFSMRKIIKELKYKLEAMTPCES